MMNAVSTVSKDKFEISFSSDYKAVFTGRGVDEVPFADGSWEMILLPYGIIENGEN